MLNTLKNITSDEFTEMIENKVNEGAKLVLVREAECYAYIGLYDGCFEHYTFDLTTKKYTATYISLTDIEIYANFLRGR